MRERDESCVSLDERRYRHSFRESRKSRMAFSLSGVVGDRSTLLSSELINRSCSTAHESKESDLVWSSWRDYFLDYSFVLFDIHLGRLRDKGKPSRDFRVRVSVLRTTRQPQHRTILSRNKHT